MIWRIVMVTDYGDIVLDFDEPLKTVPSVKKLQKAFPGLQIYTAHNMSAYDLHISEVSEWWKVNPFKMDFYSSWDAKI